jgi:hypothetical protein
VRVVHNVREAQRDANALRVAGDILRHIREMRPALPCETVVRSLDRAGLRRPDCDRWTSPFLARAVSRLVRDGFVDGSVLARTPERRDSDDLVALVAMAVQTLKTPTLTNIARRLEGLHCRTPRDETQWSVSSVQNLRGQAVAQGVLEDRSLPAPEAPRRRGCPPNDHSASSAAPLSTRRSPHP